ncbi:MAG: thrombospondin type 3 repeat-containing protein [Cellvibrionaceae bacterium]|nr:thrombospondin type 3 repeat-containing protein [Cellvibrionaceae bacterium]
MTFVGDNPVIARPGSLELFSNAFLSQGSIATDQTPQHLTHFNNTITAFLIDQLDYSIQTFDISEFSLPAIGEPADPNTTPYTPEFIETDGEDLIYLIDEQTQSVFRWSISQNKYLESWWLGNAPVSVSYSKAHARLYIGHRDGRINYFDTTAPEATEKHFTTLATAPSGLLATGNYLFTSDATGSWVTHYLFNHAGEITSQDSSRYSGAEYVFNSTLSRIYHYRSDISPNDIEWADFNPETGQWSQSGDSPYHGSQLYTKAPLRVIDNGNYVLNGAGQLLDSHSLTILNNLSNEIRDAIWINSQLVTVDSSGTQLQFWSDRFQLLNNYPLENSAFTRLLAVNGLLTIIAQTSQGPAITTYDLNNLPDSDGDSVHDLLDNCIHVANPDQTDFDLDGLGDNCDPDTDNDQISNELELHYGLNPFDPADADQDLDGDGYSNRAEALLGSALDDPQDVPTPLENYFEDFEAGTGLFILGQATNAWSSHPAGFSGKGLRSGAVSTLTSSDLELTALFSDSLLNIQLQFVGQYSFIRTLEILIDGEVVASTYGYNSWNNWSIPISAGLRTITIRAARSIFDNDDGFFVIDDVRIGKDSDGDGILDPIDNCPATYNWDQYDYDGDGLGDACDPDPYNPAPPIDTDGDGIFDFADNCPAHPNPNQEDIDGDGLGDVCDDFDNRPKDTDNDGIFDVFDNCPLIPNSDQSDLDYDGAGDACDSDIDGDGIPNEIEALYDFLDPFNPYDADMDHDNDGVSNLFEINTGTNPEEANEFPFFDLTNYLPLKEGEYAYVNDLHFITREIRKLETRVDETVVISANNWTERFEEREDGIYLVSRSNPAYLEGSRYENFLYLPKQLKLGQKVTSPVTITETSDWNSPGDFEVSLQLIGAGNAVIGGKTYHTLTIRYDYYYSQVGFGYSEDLTFAENIGWYNYGDLTLDSFAFKQDVETPEDPSDDDTEVPGNSGGGSFPLSSILLLLLVAARRTARKKVGAI